MVLWNLIRFTIIILVFIQPIITRAHEYSNRTRRQLDGIHDTRVTVTRGSLRDALRQHLSPSYNNYNSYNNAIYPSPAYHYYDASNAGGRPVKSSSENMLLRLHRDNDGLLACRKCGSYSPGAGGKCCRSCEKMGFNGCWCRPCDCMCYNMDYV